MVLGYYKLITGEIIIGKIVSETTENVSLSHIRLLFPHQVAQGQFTIELAPFILGAIDSEVSMRKDVAILGTISDIPNELEDAYIQNTSNIQIVSSNQGGIGGRLN
jgi:hypothetical protein